MGEREVSSPGFLGGREKKEKREGRGSAFPLGKSARQKKKKK